MGRNSMLPVGGRTLSPSSTPKRTRKSPKFPWGRCRGALRFTDVRAFDTRRVGGLLAAALAGGMPMPTAAAENPAEAFELPTVEVIGTTPLPGLGTALKDVPANVQSFGRADLMRQRPLDLSDFLERNANSIGVSAAQGNPYQQDLNFRGFTASPLLGTPQGLSVFQDGVRINEAFGDVVNWDLLPASAISS